MTEEKVASDSKAQSPKPTHTRRHRSLWVSVLLGAVILVSGMVIGSGVTLLWLQRKVIYMLHHPENAPAVISAHLRSRFDLTDEQTRKVEEIVRKHQQSTLALRREVQPRAEAILNDFRKDIAGVLTPDQVKEWNDYFNEMREQWLPKIPPPQDQKKGQ